MPSHQLNGKIAIVDDGNFVGKDIVVLARTRVGGLILRFHNYFYALGNFNYHDFKNKIFF